MLIGVFILAVLNAGTASKIDPFEYLVVDLPGGTFTMGNSLDTRLHPQHLPGQQVQVDAFSIDKIPATVTMFQDFVAETRYKTDSEKFGWSFVVENHATEKAKAMSDQRVTDASHWIAVPGALWLKPDGPGSFAKPLDTAGHISRNDAAAFCKWRGMRLATETEWEFAARGGLKKTRYPWGDRRPEGDYWPMNIWQGKFPKENLILDGFHRTNPEMHYEPNNYGIYDTLGNVWEWTSTKYVDSAPKKKDEPEQFVLRGGSFLDSIDGSFNHPVDINVRMSNTAESASSNTGVRCAKGIGSSKGYKYPSKSTKGIGGMDQETMQKIVEEGGIEALQKILGDKATVTTPAELKKKQEALKSKLKAMEEDMQNDEHVEL